MAPHPLVVVAIAGAVACWGKPPPPAPPVVPPVVQTASWKPRGILLLSHIPTGAQDQVLVWNDLDTGETGEIKRDLTQLHPALSVSRAALWVGNSQEMVRVARPPKGAGVVVVDLPSDQIRAVSPDTSQAIIGCEIIEPCQLGKLSDQSVLDDHPLAATTLPYPAGVRLVAWLSDGRLVFQETVTNTLTIWHVDPKTNTASPGLELKRRVSAISDDGSLITWQTEPTPNRYAVNWKHSSDAREHSLEVATKTISCQFTPTSRLLYCILGRSPKPADSDRHRHGLLLIDPATTRSREIASDVALLDTIFTAVSFDGRYLAYVAGVTIDDREQHRPMIIDLLSGEISPAGPTGTEVRVLGWLAPR